MHIPAELANGPRPSGAISRPFDSRNYTFRHGRAYSPARMVNDIATPLEAPPGAERDPVFFSVRQVDQPPLKLQHPGPIEPSLCSVGGIWGCKNAIGDCED